MTIDEAIKDIRKIEIETCGNAESLEIAIASLARWRDFKAEIRKIWNDTPVGRHPAYYEGLNVAIDVVDRYLKEILRNENDD